MRRHHGVAAIDLGILQADAYAGFNTVYKPERKPGPIIEAACWAHNHDSVHIAGTSAVPW
jgi:transposase